jgi:hypothetical protein
VRAGVAQVDITPGQPVTLAGYASRKELSEGVHDRLSARAVAFEEGGRRLVLVSTDLIGFYGDSLDAIRGAIREATGLREDELFLTAIHTHSAPVLVVGEGEGHANNLAYTRQLKETLAALVRDALGHMEAAEIGAGSGASPVGANRRETVKDPSGATRIVLGRNPSGSTDPEVQVVVVARAGEERPKAVLFAYATHSTSLGPGNLRISGDVHGLAERFVEAQLGRGIIAPAFAGASGDIDPWYRVLPGFRTDDGWTPEPDLLGTLLGEEVVHVVRRVRPMAAAGPVRTASATIELPGKPVGQDKQTSDDSTKALALTVGRVGDVAFVGLGCEAFHAVGKAIKAASPFPTTLVITHCNGAAGYLPTRDAYPQGGYEIQSSPFAPGADERVVEEVTKLLRTLAP